MKYSCTAVFWKSESCDYYLHAFNSYMTEKQAREKMAEIYGDEFTECCCDFKITWG